MTRIGLSAYGMPARDLLELSIAADRLGFDGLWLGEHLFHPAEYSSKHPSDGSAQHHTGPIVVPDTELVDPWVVFGAIAAATTHLRVATGIYLLPLRHPLLTARTVATAQELSGGRVVLGIGAGWLREEFDALDIAYAERMPRLEESVEVLRKAWAGGTFAHSGRHFCFPSLQVTARRVDVPLVLGGNGPKALARAARLGDGWFSSGTPSMESAVALRDALVREREQASRTEPFRCVFRVEDLDAQAVSRYGSEGIDDLVLWADKVWVGATREDRERSLARCAHALGLDPHDVPVAAGS
ncbi:MAG: Luciferase-like monooxygenase [Frankiales bacterium]|nr:Luciferase-like monooxygenase [Frankiales bacterium]